MASHGVPRGPATTRTEEQKRQDAEKIKTFRALEADILGSTVYDEAVFDRTTRLLRLNPEFYTAWNVRRRCLVAAWEGHEDKDEGDGGPRSRLQDAAAVLADELQFTIPLLLEAPKCYWIWSYRLWLLQQAVQRLDRARARRIWEDELALDARMLAKDRRNFHAWGYRRQVVERLESADLCGDESDEAARSLVEPEFAYTTQMIRRDLSNFSAWHQRSKLIPRLLAERHADDAARTAFLEGELALVRDALNVGPEDQSLWFYHEFLVRGLTEPPGSAAAAALSIAPHLAPAQRAAYLARELADIRDLLADYDDVKWIYEALLEYTLAAAALDARPLAPAERADARAWLARLRALDPMRNGRWDDLAGVVGAA